MIKNKTLKTIGLIMLSIIILFNSNICYAADIDLSNPNYKPNLVMGSSAGSIIGNILNALTILGVVSVAVVIALLGFNSILGSASEKADIQQKLVGVIIAAGLLTSGSIIAKFIVSFALNI